MTDDISKVVLKPCPFCGSTDIGEDYVQTYSVDSSYDVFGCRGCGARFENGNAADWNRRLESATTPAEVEAIGDVLYELETLESDVNGVADYTGRVRAHIATLARQLAEAKAANEIAASVHEHERMNFQVQLAAATRRVAEVDGLLAESLPIIEQFEKLCAALGLTKEAALQKEPG